MQRKDIVLSHSHQVPTLSDLATYWQVEPKGNKAQHLHHKVGLMKKILSTLLPTTSQVWGILIHYQQSRGRDNLWPTEANQQGEKATAIFIASHQLKRWTIQANQIYKFHQSVTSIPVLFVPISFNVFEKVLDVAPSLVATPRLILGASRPWIDLRKRKKDFLPKLLMCSLTLEDAHWIVRELALCDTPMLRTHVEYLFVIPWS